MFEEKIDLVFVVFPVAVVVVLPTIFCWLVVLLRGGAEGM